MSKLHNITKVCPCNIQRFISVVKNSNTHPKILDIFLFLLKTKIEVTRQNCLDAKLKIRKLGKPLSTPVLLYKVGLERYTFHGLVFPMNFFYCVT